MDLSLKSPLKELNNNLSWIHDNFVKINEKLDKSSENLNQLNTNFQTYFIDLHDSLQKTPLIFKENIDCEESSTNLKINHFENDENICSPIKNFPQKTSDIFSSLRKHNNRKCLSKFKLFNLSNKKNEDKQKNNENEYQKILADIYSEHYTRNDQKKRLEEVFLFLEKGNLPITSGNVEKFLLQKSCSDNYKNRIRKIFNAKVFSNVPKQFKLKMDPRGVPKARNLIYPNEKIKIFEILINKLNYDSFIAIHWIFVQTAARGIEVVNLTKKNLISKEVNSSKYWIFIPTKKTLGRVIRISEKLYKTLQFMCSNKSNDDLIFPEFHKSSDNLRKSLAYNYEKLGIPETHGIHCWRHTKVNELSFIYNKTLEEIRVWMGHKNITTTQKYFLRQSEYEEEKFGANERKIKENYVFWKEFCQSEGHLESELCI